MAKPNLTGKVKAKRSTGKVNHEFAQLIADGEVDRVNLSLVDRDPNQPRSLKSVLDSIEEFAAELKRDGLAQYPVYHRKSDGRLQIIVGERRTEAFKFNSEETIPAVVKTFTSEEIRRIKELQYAENDSRNRKPLNTIEDASWWKSYIDEFFDGNQGNAAIARGVSASYVSKKLAPLKASKEIKEFIQDLGTADGDMVASLIKLDNEAPFTAKEWMLDVKRNKIVGSLRDSIRDTAKSHKNTSQQTTEQPTGKKIKKRSEGEGPFDNTHDENTTWPKTQTMDVSICENPDGESVLVLSNKGQMEKVISIGHSLVSLKSQIDSLVASEA